MKYRILNLGKKLNTIEQKEVIGGFPAMCDPGSKDECKKLGFDYCNSLGVCVKLF
ncbi:hypothetical protein [Tenacibaculum halocynthiae]|uniref:hypothetical protein n=1 Tax=Tenacibaculum halocynthiae TaxID=1254437 RepID=UPI0038964819